MTTISELDVVATLCVNLEIFEQFTTCWSNNCLIPFMKLFFIDAIVKTKSRDSNEREFVSSRDLNAKLLLLAARSDCSSIVLDLMTQLTRSCFLVSSFI